MHRLLAAAAAAAFLALPALAQPTPPRQPTITVSGSAEIELKPDLARLMVSVVTQADTAPQAADLNKAATDRVLARIQALGVKRDDIRTVNIQVFPTPQRTRPDGSEIRVPRFTASHQLRILSRDIDGVGKLAGDIIASGDMTLHSVAFGRDNDTEAQDSARREAVKNARHQAEVFAQAAGVTLGRLLEIRNASVQPATLDTDGLFKAGIATRQQEMSIVPPATVRTGASVEMVWEIAP